MDKRCMNGSLVSLPKCLTDIEISLGSDREIIQTFKKIERKHWNYLDNYRDQNRRKYPTLNLQQFTLKLLHMKGILDVNTKDIMLYIRLYNRYKKGLPTAGVILYHITQDGELYFLTIRMRFAKIYSMPKGKHEANENLKETACREFREETGVDLDDCMNNEHTPFYIISKTRFYMIESDHMQQDFNGYNMKEVDEVRWTSVNEVLDYPSNYSKQTAACAKLLYDTYS